MILLSCVIIVTMMPNLCWLWIAQGPLLWFRAAIIPAFLILLMLAITARRLWLTCILLAPFAALAPLESFYIINYLHPSSAEIYATVFATNIREVHEFLGRAVYPLGVLCIGSFVLALYTASCCRREKIVWTHTSRYWILAAALCIPLATIGTVVITNRGSSSRAFGITELIANDTAYSIEAGFPFGVLIRVNNYRKQANQLRVDIAKIKNFKFDATAPSKLKTRQIYVLVIGESSRRDHWRLFGYGRETNPELSHTANLVPITNMVSSWAETIAAVPMIVTRKPSEDTTLGWKEASILRAMNESGFDTYWISNQLGIGETDSPVSIYAHDAHHVEFLSYSSWSEPGSYDEILRKPLAQTLDDSQGNLFIVLHMMGSHRAYDFRYPKSFSYFTPTTSDPLGSSNNNDQINNSYDNTIRYTDHVLSEIIETLRESNAVTALFYESDHGEDLPTSQCTLSNHGNGTIYDFEIPALFWYSDQYAAAFPQRVAAIRDNASKRVVNSDTFASLIGMTGVGLPDQDETRNLFGDKWQYHTRWVNLAGLWQSNIDEAAIGKKCKIVLPVKPH